MHNALTLPLSVLPPFFFLRTLRAKSKLQRLCKCRGRGYYQCCVACWLALPALPAPIRLIPRQRTRLMAQPQPAPYFPAARQPHNIGAYQRAIAVLVVLVVILGVLALYLYANPVTPSVSQTSDLNSQVDSLRSQVNNLQNQLTQFQGAYLKGDFDWHNDCSALGSCSYVLNGAVANMGATTAYSAQVTFTFYSGEHATGQVLCTTTYSLGTVAPHSIATITEVTCAGTTSTEGSTVSWTFNHS